MKTWTHLVALLFISSVFLMQACSPVYVKNFKYERFVRASAFEKADQFLEDNKFLLRNRNRLLFCFEKGKILHLQGKYTESNHFLNEADRLIEDLRMDVGSEALSLLTNDQMRPYRPEDFEIIAMHYYKTLNYLALHSPYEALVEVKRMNLALQAINDKYPDHKNKYQDDALGHILMGCTYERLGDYNNAFIAFRNAYNLFDEVKGQFMGVKVPNQLIEDLIYNAEKSGFTSEATFYKKKHRISIERENASGGYVYLFWENGLGPVKSEWSVNFTILPLGESKYAFINNDLNLSFPFEYEKKKNKKKKEGNEEEKEDDGIDIDDIQFLRVAFPRYVSRPYQFKSPPSISVNRRNYQLEMVEDIDYIARKSLEDRFFREAAKGLLRLATKKITELSIRKENETAGALLGVVNAISEKADTRNWQTLPSAVYYTKIPLRKGKNTVNIDLNSNNGIQSRSIEIIGKGNIEFLNIQSFSPFSDIKPSRYYSEMESEKNTFLSRE